MFYIIDDINANIFTKKWLYNLQGKLYLYYYSITYSICRIPNVYKNQMTIITTNPSGLLPHVDLVYILPFNECGLEQFTQLGFLNYIVQLVFNKAIINDKFKSRSYAFKST